MIGLRGLLVWFTFLLSRSALTSLWQVLDLSESGHEVKNVVSLTSIQSWSHIARCFPFPLTASLINPVYGASVSSFRLLSQSG